MKIRTNRLAAVALSAALGLGAAACASEDPDVTVDTEDTAEDTADMEEGDMGDDMESEDGVDDMESEDGMEDDMESEDSEG